MEKKKLSFHSAPHDDRNLADIHLGLYDDVIVFDLVEKVLRLPYLKCQMIVECLSKELLDGFFQKVFVIHWVRLDQYASVENAYKDGIKRLENLVAKVQAIDPYADSFTGFKYSAFALQSSYVFIF